MFIKSNLILLKQCFIPILLLFILLFHPKATFPTEGTTVRVAYIPDNSHYTMEENGGLSGYNFDYLMLVAQHTGWQYEFIEVDEGSYEASFSKAKEMFLSDEVDLIGSVSKTPENEEFFQFPSLSSGVNRHNLFSHITDFSINQDNYFLQEVLTVALVEGAEINESFFTLAHGQGLKYEIAYVKSDEIALELLQKGAVEAIVDSTTAAYCTELTFLFTIDRVPFYFVAQKGNEKLMEDLSDAIEKINTEEPTVQQRLTNEYFGTQYEGSITLTPQESQALADYPYLSVGLLKGREPYQFYTDEERAVPDGISVEILEQISQMIGVEFRYVWMDSREEMRDKIASQEIDLCTTVPYDSDFQLNTFFDVVITQPYLSNAVVWLHQTGADRDTSPLYYYLADNIPLFPDDELTEIHDFSTKLEELSKNGQTSIFADPYMAQYMIQKLELTNIEMQTLSTVHSKICFGVGKHLDSSVVGLLNHALLHLDPFIVDEIIYNNVTVENNLSLRAFYEAHSIEIITAITLFFLSITVFLVQNGRKLKQITQQDSLTKLYNAGFFHHYSEEKTKHLSSGCLILIDIDFFKQVNDNYGHQEGDNIIIRVADTLKENFRHYDIVARLGGDEFIILIENKPDTEELKVRSQKILDSLADSSHKVPVTLSIGGYIFNQQTSYNNLYKLADDVLYKVKEKGRNGYLFEEKN